MKNLVIPVLAITVILILELYALSRDINGVCMSASIGAVGGIAGWWIKVFKDYIRGKR